MNKLDKSFKVLINKEFTSPSRSAYEELGSDTLNIHSREVWVDTISSDATEASSSEIAKWYDKFELTADLGYPANAFYFTSQSNNIGGFIGDKYGIEYKAKLFDNDDNEIFETDTIDWLFDYVTGILTIANPELGSYSTPYKISAYKYIGTILTDALESSSFSGTDNYIPMFSQSGGTITNSIISQSGNDIYLPEESIIYATSSYAMSSPSKTTEGIVEKTSDWDLLASEAGYLIRANSTGSIVCTIQTNAIEAIPVTSIYTFIQAGVGQLSLETGSGVTINSLLNDDVETLSTAGQYAGLQVIKIDTDVWDCIGGVLKD